MRFRFILGPLNDWKFDEKERVKMYKILLKLSIFIDRITLFRRGIYIKITRNRKSYELRNWNKMYIENYL